jgi:type IV pilus assembly protein PilV
VPETEFVTICNIVVGLQTDLFPCYSKAAVVKKQVLRSFTARRSRADGFSLIEVLVSIIILTVGLMGASGMLLSAIRTTNESGGFSAAVSLARELSEKTRINKSVSIDTDTTKNTYLVSWKRGDSLPGTSTPGTTCISAVCTNAELAAWDINEWMKRVNSTLPGARVVVCFDSDSWNSAASEYEWACDSTGRNLVVKMSWTPRQTNAALKDVDAATRLPRVVLQLIPGQNYSAYTPPGF